MRLKRNLSLSFTIIVAAFFSAILGLPHHSSDHNDGSLLENTTTNETTISSEPPPASISTTTATITYLPTRSSTTTTELPEVVVFIPGNFSTKVVAPSTKDDDNNNRSSSATSSSIVEDEVALESSTSTTTILSANSPSIMLLPPPLPLVLAAAETSSSSSSSPPQQQQVVETGNPELSNIPLTTISIAGNSGGTTGSSSNKNDLHVDFTRFRYHVKSGQLQKIGSTDGCPENMRFFAIPGNSKSGSCDCDYYQCSRPLIYSREKDQCYWAWSQGPCEKGEWFVFEKNLKTGGKCLKNPCPESSSSSTNGGSLEYYFHNSEDSTCYQAGSQGYCKDTDERLMIYPGEPIPKCRKFTLCYPLSVPQELQCVYGNKYFFEGNCY